MSITDRTRPGWGSSTILSPGPNFALPLCFPPTSPGAPRAPPPSGQHRPSPTRGAAALRAHRARSSPSAGGVGCWGLAAPVRTCGCGPGRAGRVGKRRVRRWGPEGARGLLLAAGGGGASRSAPTRPDVTAPGGGGGGEGKGGGGGEGRHGGRQPRGAHHGTMPPPALPASPPAPSATSLPPAVPSAPSRSTRAPRAAPPSPNTTASHRCTASPSATSAQLRHGELHPLPQQPVPTLGHPLCK